MFSFLKFNRFKGARSLAYGRDTPALFTPKKERKKLYLGSCCSSRGCGNCGKREKALPRLRKSPLFFPHRTVENLLSRYGKFSTELSTRFSTAYPRVFHRLFHNPALGYPLISLIIARISDCAFFLVFRSISTLSMEDMIVE